MKIKHLETLTTASYFHGGTLPCVVRVMKAAPSNVTVAMHGHEFSELVLVAAGSLKHLHRAKTETLNAGDFLVVHPGARHGYAELADDTVVYNLIFTSALRRFAHLFAANPLLGRIFPASDDLRTDILGTADADTTARAVRLMDEIRAEEKSPVATSPACCGALFAATVALLARGLHTHAGVCHRQTEIQDELAYLKDHLGEKITLKTLCAVAGKSPSTLNRLFLDILGKSPINTLIDRRLDEAEILCATTGLTRAKIAVLCGFADTSHLLRTFHRRGRELPRGKAVSQSPSLHTH